MDFLDLKLLIWISRLLAACSVPFPSKDLFRMKCLWNERNTGVSSLISSVQSYTESMKVNRNSKMHSKQLFWCLAIFLVRKLVLNYRDDRSSSSESKRFKFFKKSGKDWNQEKVMKTRKKNILYDWYIGRRKLFALWFFGNSVSSSLPSPANIGMLLAARN